jgi:N-acyl-D-aspartate/D-glutamate deacylase
VLDAVREAIEVGEKAGMPVEIFHLKVAYKPGWGVLMDSVGRLVDAARARGVDVAADMYVYTAGGTGLEATIPRGRSRVARTRSRRASPNPRPRARLKREIRAGSPGWWNIVEASGGWNGIVPRQRARTRRTPLRAEDDRADRAGVAQIPRTPRSTSWPPARVRVMAIYHMMGEADIETALRFPWTSIGSDAGSSVESGVPTCYGLPHPRSYGNVPRVIARYVRERHVLTLPEAIRKMTSWPAERMRIADRGLLRPGMWADVVVFDYDSIQDRATYERPTEFPTGIDYVLVNGQVVIDHGKHTGAKPGAGNLRPGRGEGRVRPRHAGPRQRARRRRGRRRRRRRTTRPRSAPRTRRRT